MAHEPAFVSVARIDYSRGKHGPYEQRTEQAALGKYECSRCTLPISKERYNCGTPLCTYCISGR